LELLCSCLKFPFVFTLCLQLFPAVLYLFVLLLYQLSSCVPFLLQLSLQFLDLSFHVKNVTLTLLAQDLSRIQTETAGMSAAPAGTVFQLVLEHLKLHLCITDLLVELVELSLCFGFIEVIFTLCEELLLRDIEKLLVRETKRTLYLRYLLSELIVFSFDRCKVI
jgi:hypothetical protein